MTELLNNRFDEFTSFLPLTGQRGIRMKQLELESWAAAQICLLMDI